MVIEGAKPKLDQSVYYYLKVRKKGNERSDLNLGPRGVFMYDTAGRLVQ